MAIERVEIVNHRAFGEHVKAWAKGLAPIPETLEEFTSQLVQVGVGLKIPDTIQKVRFVQDDADTLVVRLPCRARLAQAEAELAKQAGSYPLPALYEQALSSRPKIADQLAFQAARIGDYCIAQCV